VSSAIRVDDLIGSLLGRQLGSDFDLVIQYLSYNAAGLAQKFVLSQTPSNIGDANVYVDGVEVTYHVVTGWSWLPDENAI
jgi:hypothetical protein